MRHLLHGVAAAVVGLLVAAAPLTADATSFLEMTADEAIDRADLIVRGTVTEVWTERDPNGRVFTYAQLEVEHVLKGDEARDSVIIKQIGGVWGGRPTLVAGMAQFSAGENVVLYLEEAKDGYLRPQRMGYSKWNVRIDPHSGEEIVQRFFAPPGRDFDHRFIPAPAKADRIFLSDFSDRIEQRVATTKLEVK